jgi:hypothetical protein
MAKRHRGSGSERDAVRVLKKKAGKRSGLVKTVIYMKPEHLAALVTEARKRADERGAVRADASAVAREALDAWVKLRK